MRGLEDFYSGVIASRGYFYPEQKIDPRTKWKILMRSFPPTAPLPAGTSVHLIDTETNLETPVTIPAGYWSDFLEWYFNSDTKLYLHCYLDGNYLGAFVIGADYSIHEYERVIWSSTRFTDPEAELDHVWDFVLENPTTSDAIGFVHVALRIEKAGSGSKPRIVRCVSCKKTFEGDKKATRFKCPYCNKEFILFLFGWWEG